MYVHITTATIIIKAGSQYDVRSLQCISSSLRNVKIRELSRPEARKQHRGLHGQNHPLIYIATSVNAKGTQCNTTSYCAQLLLTHRNSYGDRVRGCGSSIQTSLESDYSKVTHSKSSISLEEKNMDEGHVLNKLSYIKL